MFRYFVGSKGSWTAQPAKPELDRDSQRKFDINGKPAYAPILEWLTREINDGFSEAVIASVRRAHPGHLDVGSTS
jgi:hypothetical protein